MSYKVLRQLSGGGFAEVFEVEDTASALSERLILKRLSAEMSARAEVRTAFADEAKILRELKHPNVVTFRRCYFDELQRVCLLMEKVGGEPLDAWARRHSSQPLAVLDVLERVLQAVDYLHRRPVPFLHLDLKPDNILVSSSAAGPQPVLIDFGIARRSGGKGLKAYTPPYGAPEQQAGGALDPSTDVHALGQLLGELLDALPALAGPVREALRNVGTRAKDPAQRSRYQDAGEMGFAVRRARRTVPVPPPRIRLPVEGWQAALGAAVLVILLVAGATWRARPVVRAPAVEAGQTSFIQHEFDRFVRQARTATAQDRFDIAEEQYKQALLVCQSLPEADPEAQRMKRDLEDLRNDIGKARQGESLDGTVRLVGP